MNEIKTLQIWPVIHVLMEQEALEDADTIINSGCDGLFLIQMHGYDHLLDPIFKAIRAKHPKFPIGVNYLSLTASNALERSLSVGYNATWSDNPGVHSSGVSTEAYLIGAALEHNTNHTFFGSVAFKYQAPDYNPVLAASFARRQHMIPTTSGTATGIAPDVAKLEAIFNSAPDAPLAVASGLAADNIGILGRYITHAIIATSISNKFDRIDGDKLNGFIKAAKL